MQAAGYRTFLLFGAGWSSEEQLCLSNAELRQDSLWSGLARPQLPLGTSWGSCQGLINVNKRMSSASSCFQVCLSLQFLQRHTKSSHAINPHRTLFIKTNKRALAVQKSASLQVYFSCSSFRSSADGSCSLLSLSNFPQPVTSAQPCTSSAPIMQDPFPQTPGMVFSTFTHPRQSCNKGCAEKAQQYINKRKAWLFWRWDLWEAERRDKGGACSLYGHSGSAAVQC